MATDDKPTGRALAKKEGGIGWLIFSSPGRRNAVTVEMTTEAAAILEDFARDDAVRVVVLRGDGEKDFISGGDISQFNKLHASAADRAKSNDIRSGAREMLANIEKPR
jgi:enoyl-CoA hydratase